MVCSIIDIRTLSIAKPFLLVAHCRIVRSEDEPGLLGRVTDGNALHKLGHQLLASH